jgi:hypothetical protein
MMSRSTNARIPLPVLATKVIHFFAHNSPGGGTSIGGKHGSKTQPGSLENGNSWRGGEGAAGILLSTAYWNPRRASDSRLHEI